MTVGAVSLAAGRAATFRPAVEPAALLAFRRRLLAGRPRSRSGHKQRGARRSGNGSLDMRSTGVDLHSKVGLESFCGQCGTQIGTGGVVGLDLDADWRASPSESDLLRMRGFGDKLWIIRIDQAMTFVHVTVDRPVDQSRFKYTKNASPVPI